MELSVIHATHLRVTNNIILLLYLYLLIIFDCEILSTECRFEHCAANSVYWLRYCQKCDIAHGLYFDYFSDSKCEHCHVLIETHFNFQFLQKMWKAYIGAGHQNIAFHKTRTYGNNYTGIRNAVKQFRDFRTLFFIFPSEFRQQIVIAHFEFIEDLRNSTRILFCLIHVEFLTFKNDYKAKYILDYSPNISTKNLRNNIPLSIIAPFSLSVGTLLYREKQPLFCWLRAGQKERLSDMFRQAAAELLHVGMPLTIC